MLPDSSKPVSDKTRTVHTVRVDKFNFSCYCLERPGPDTVEEGKKKRIPVGTYQVIWHETEKNKKLGTSFNLFNVNRPGFIGDRFA